MSSTPPQAVVTQSSIQAIVWAPATAAAKPSGLCTDCGISRTVDDKRCGQACQFLAPDYPNLEANVHGRSRDETKPDEFFFGPFRRMVRAALASPSPGAQWTGITTRIAERLLETGAVEAVLTMAPDPNDAWRPVPVIVTKAEGMQQCRGMRMGYAPLLALLEPVAACGYKRIAVIGIPCQVYALRSIEAELGLEQLYVIGTPCSDNTTTERFHQFLELISEEPQNINYLEFRADHHVEIRYTDGRVQSDSVSDAAVIQTAQRFFSDDLPHLCGLHQRVGRYHRGFQGGEGQQWLIVRNERGEELLNLLGEEVVTEAPGSRGKRFGPVKGFLGKIERAAGGLPLRSMPDWLRPIVGWLMPKVGPRWLEFARARVEMKAIETVLHLRREHAAKSNTWCLRICRNWSRRMA